MRSSAPPWRLPAAVSALGTAGDGRLWVFASARPGGPPSELLEVDPQHRKVLFHFSLPPGVVGEGTSADGAAFVARPLELEEWWAGRQQRFPLPTGTEAVAVAPVSHAAVWVAFRLGTTGRVEVGLYRLPEEVLVDAHHVAGMANEAVASLAAAPGGCWVASEPRPTLYWVLAQGGPSTYTRLYANLVALAGAGSLMTVAVDLKGSGWVSGTTVAGRPALWPVQGAARAGSARVLPASVSHVGVGLAVSLDGTAYVAVASAKDVPGVVRVPATGAMVATFWPSLAPKGGTGRLGAFGTVLAATSGRLYAATPAGLLLSLDERPAPGPRRTT